MRDELEFLWVFRWRVLSGLVAILGAALLVVGVIVSAGLPPIN